VEIVLMPITLRACRDGDGQTVELVEDPKAQRRFSTCAAAVRMTVEDSGCSTIARIDVAVACGLIINQTDGESTISLHTAHFTIIPT
jgi:hypothetical protein